MDANDALPIRTDELLRHRAWVGALARALVRDDSTAEDLVQDTFTTALERPPDRRTSLRNWLATVLRNRLRDRYRAESRRNRREEAVARSESTPSAADLAATADAHRQVLDAVVALEEPYREAVLLRYYEGRSVTEVAERQGVPASTARTRLKRARDRLRDTLDGDHERDGRAWALALTPLLAIRPEPAGARPVGAVGGLGGFLMAHKVKLVAAGLFALVLVSVVVSAGGPQGGDPARPPDDGAPVLAAAGEERVPVDGPAKDGAEAKREDSTFRLPTTNRMDAVALPIEDGATIGVERTGTLSFGDIRVRTHEEIRERLLVPFLRFADAKRDLNHPMQPSECGVLFRADGRTPWSEVRNAMHLPASPDMRIWRIYWAARQGESEVGVPVFFPKDRGLAGTKVRMLQPHRIHVTLSRASATAATTVTLLDRKLGEDEKGLASLEKELPALIARATSSPVVIHVADAVPFAQVIRALDLVPEPRSHHLEAFLRKVPKYRLPAGPPGLLVRSVKDLEGRFIPKEEDRTRVRELVTSQEFSSRKHRELLDKTRPSRTLALSLGRAYLKRDEKDDILRAVTLGAFVSGAETASRYDAIWWEAEVLILRAMLAYAKASGDAQATGIGLKIGQSLTDLGLLDRSPRRGYLLRIHGEFEALREEKK